MVQNLYKQLLLSAFQVSFQELRELLISNVLHSMYYIVDLPVSYLE